MHGRWRRMCRECSCTLSFLAASFVNKRVWVMTFSTCLLIWTLTFQRLPMALQILQYTWRLKLWNFTYYCNRASQCLCCTCVLLGTNFEISLSWALNVKLSPLHPIVLKTSPAKVGNTPICHVLHYHSALSIYRESEKRIFFLTT